MGEPKPFRERLEWDLEAGEIRDGSVRYLLIRPDTLMGLFALLDAPSRAAALKALADSTVRYGSKSAEHYQRMGAAEPDRLITVIEGTAPQLGWGRWRFKRTGERSFELQVSNSPFAAGFGRAEAPVCAGIAGMFTAVLGLVLGPRAEAREVECAAMGAERCRFLGTAPAKGNFT